MVQEGQKLDLVLRQRLLGTVTVGGAHDFLGAENQMGTVSDHAVLQMHIYVVPVLVVADK